MANKSLVLYDGVCHLCNAFVRFIIRRDRAKRFEFSHLQSPISKDRLSGLPPFANKLNTVVLLEDGRAFTRSTAVLRITRHLDGAWPIFYVFILVPRFVRDAAYDLIGKYRFRLFGRSNQCLIPSAQDRDRFVG
jgi:predicted DCC family thiol-disulfide oxidoreductase YuxK